MGKSTNNLLHNRARRNWMLSFSQVGRRAAPRLEVLAALYLADQHPGESGPGSLRPDRGGPGGHRRLIGRSCRPRQASRARESGCAARRRPRGLADSINDHRGRAGGARAPPQAARHQSRNVAQRPGIPVTAKIARPPARDLAGWTGGAACRRAPTIVRPRPTGRVRPSPACAPEPAARAGSAALLGLGLAAS